MAVRWLHGGTAIMLFPSPAACAVEPARLAMSIGNFGNVIKYEQSFFHISSTYSGPALLPAFRLDVCSPLCVLTSFDAVLAYKI